ncbi:hypothetical protein [Agromyces mariniharenae]|uniref:Uncharacterized protein n=1 Tax=Agromyces mariniharenae TaxID=2604423 RepID=A0A5S4VA53_9MICO|nr:hypothetical protein [Agromyces mariniharenae]TYL53490.1 hypothetical protein FYC51_07405 [Agromyces mariniharenae]
MDDRRSLGERSPSEARAELLAAARAFAARRRPADLLAQWADDPSVRPSHVDQRRSTRLDAMALDAASEYEALLLSPVAPLGASSVVAPTSQDRTLTTMRTTEVVSDPSNVLAVVAASRLRREPRASVRLCTAHQVLRMQAPPPGRGYTKHFRMFALADAGRGLPSDGFEVAAVIRQLGAHRRLVDAAVAEFGWIADRPTIVVRTDDRYPALAERLGSALAEAMPEVAVRTEALSSGYYAGLRVGFGVHGPVGAHLGLVDLGVHDWVARLTGDDRQRFVASAMGIQLLPLLAPER